MRAMDMPANTRSAPRKQIGPMVFSHDGMPGYRRLRRGRGFCYVDPSGAVLKDQAERDRILSLAIPPAYVSVWICMRADGHLQATGVDVRGRKQYIYHQEWHRLSSQRKFEVLPSFVLALPRIRRRVSEALGHDALDRDRILAGVVALIDMTGFRVGGRRYARQNRSYGMSSLLCRHLMEEESGWVLRFRGKAGKRHEAMITDARLTALFEQLHELPGQHLFRYQDEVGEWHDVGTADVNGWLKDAAGSPFTAKQFRTWRATVICARLLGADPPPASPTEEKRRVAEACRSTAVELRQTMTVCRKYYVHPEIFRAFKTGKLHQVMNRRAPLLRRFPGASGLRADERRVLSLIA